MKRTILLAISILLILSACSSPKPIPTATSNKTEILLPTRTSIPTLPILTSTPNRIDTADSWKAIRLYASSLFMGDNVISPDGQWIIANPFSVESGKNNQIVSIENPLRRIGVKYTSPGHESNLQMYQFDSWSPDSKNIAGIFGSGPKHCCGNGIAVSNFSDGEAESWVYHWDWDEYPEIFWANDSSKIGLGFREHGILLFDRKGNLINKYSLNYTTDAIWVDNSIYIVSMQDDHVALYAISIQAQTIEKIYDFQDYSSVNLLGYQPKSNTLVFAAYESYKFKHIAFLDFEALRISENSFILENVKYPIVVSQPFRYVGLLVDDEADQNGFWILDTEENKLDYIGQTGILVGWYTNINGFLILTWENDEPKIVTP